MYQCFLGANHLSFEAGEGYRWFGLGKNLFFPQTSDCVSSDWLQSNHLAIRPTCDILKFILCYEAWGNKSSWTAVMNNTFLLFYSLKPHSNIWILIHQNWLEPISLPKHPFLLSPLLFAAGDISHGGMSATQRLKFHTDDANQFLHNKSSSRGVPNINLSNFMCLLVDFGKVLCSSANELQQNSNASSTEDYIPQILTVLLGILRFYIWPLWPFVFCLSFVNSS